MAVRRLVLIHPRELEIPTLEDINLVTNMNTLPEDNEKAQDDENDRIIVIEDDDVSNNKTLQENEAEDIDNGSHNN